MFVATFNLVTWTIVLFGTLKDGSLQIITLTSNNCFSYRNVFQNGVNAFFFYQKCSSDHIIETGM